MISQPKTRNVFRKIAPTAQRNLFLAKFESRVRSPRVQLRRQPSVRQGHCSSSKFFVGVLRDHANSRSRQRQFHKRKEIYNAEKSAARKNIPGAAEQEQNKIYRTIIVVVCLAAELPQVAEL
jgi:hypothetical protein